MIARIVVLVCVLAGTILCDDGSGYVFELNTTDDWYHDIENMTEFEVRSFSFINTFACRLSMDFEERGSDSKEIHAIQSFSNVIASMRRNDELKPNHETQKLNGTAFKMVIDSTGTIASVVGADDDSQEVLETMAANAAVFGGTGEGGEFRFPLGGDTLRYVGDKWVFIDIKEAATSTFGFEKFEGTQTTTTTYRLKKVKEKKGGLIAYLHSDAEVIIQGIGINWDETMEFVQNGVFKSKMQFNLTQGIVKSNKFEAVLNTKGTNLEDDSSITFNMAIAMAMKGKLK